MQWTPATGGRNAREVLSARPSWHRGLALAGIGAGIVAFVAFAALTVGTSGVAEWDGWLDLMLLGLMIVGVVVTSARWRAGDPDLGWLVLATSSLACAQAMLCLGVGDWMGDATVSPDDLVYMGWYVGVGVFLVRHLRGLPAWARFTHLIESAMLTASVLFISWELFILPTIPDPSAMSIGDQISTILYPALDLALASLVVLVLFVDRSPARVALAVGLSLLAAADIAIVSAETYPVRSTFLIAAPAWIVGGILVLAAMGLPGGGRIMPFKPSVPRLLVVSGMMAVALWLGTFRYIVGDTPPSAVTVTMAIIAGGVWTASRVGDFLQARTTASALNANIAALEHAQQELRALLDDLPEAVVVLDQSGSIREANANVSELTGLPHHVLLGKYFTDLFRDDQREHLVQIWRRVRKGEQVGAATLRYERPDGTIVLLEGSTNFPVADRDRVVIALRDVTERLAEAGRLERARERFRLAFHNAPTGMALSSALDGVLVDVNDSLAEMLGTTRDELIGRTAREITHPDDWVVASQRLREALDQRLDSYRVEIRYLRDDGGTVWARTWVSVLDDGEGGTWVLAHVEDVTEQRHSAERLEWAATHDGLTRLPNRFRFLDRLGTHLIEAEPGSVAVLFIDLDNFKVINDSLGHDAGDQLLQIMSERLRGVVRDRDLLGRFGGDEFIIMLRDVSGGFDPFRTADELRRAVAEPVIIEGAELFVTASIGITVNDREGVTTTDMLRDADAAMYRAKARGRDCVEVFSPDSHDATVLSLRTSSELRRGLQHGEIVPYYQPVIDLRSRRLMGFEVLARWRHPDRGLLGPDQFLPLAEETGLIGEVGAAVMKQSLVQLGRWRNSSESFRDLTLAVNVSARQLTSSQLVDDVSVALTEAGVPAAALWLEITETALMSDVKAATVALRELRSLGLHLAVDDFGTGYSSLTYLKRFPVEAIKIDRGFVNGLGIDTEDSTIVEAVVNLGHSLNLQVVAEGVETPLQWERLRELGCDGAQGYLFGRPRPAELIEQEYALL